MQIWYILFYSSLGGIVLGTILLIVFRFLKRIPYQDYVEDSLIKEKETEHSRNLLYFTHGETRKYIMRYVFCKGQHEKYVICNYNKKYEEIRLFVVCYNSKNKIIGIYNYREIGSMGATSKIIPVNYRTKKVNIIIAKVNDIVINHSVYKPVKRSFINLYSLITSIIVFCTLFAIRHLLAMGICRTYFYSFLNSLYNTISWTACFVIAIVYCLLSMLILNKKNKRAVVGGVVEHEFV